MVMLANNNNFLPRDLCEKRPIWKLITKGKSRGISREDSGWQPSPQPRRPCFWAHGGELHLLADRRPLPGLLIERRLSPQSPQQGCPVACGCRGARCPRRPAAQPCPRAPCRPGPWACLHPRGRGLIGPGGDPGKTRFLAVGAAHSPPCLGAGAAMRRGWGVRSGVGGTCSRRPRTFWKEHRVKRSPLLPVSLFPACFDRHPSFPLGFASPSAEGGVRRGRQPRSGSARTSGPRAATRGHRLLSFVSWGWAPEGAFLPFLDSGNPAHPALAS